MAAKKTTKKTAAKKATKAAPKKAATKKPAPRLARGRALAEIVIAHLAGPKSPIAKVEVVLPG